jgi:predicted nucleic acid-binding protein
MTWMVDASIAMKWLVPERLSEHTGRILASGEPILAPDLLYVEATTALWKKAKRREITLAETERAPLVTADARFLAAAQKRRLRVRVVDLAAI